MMQTCMESARQMQKGAMAHHAQCFLSVNIKQCTQNEPKASVGQAKLNINVWEIVADTWSHLSSELSSCWYSWE